MYAVNANVIWMACDAAGGVARVYKTTNGGTTWLLRNSGIPTTQNGYGIFAFDTTTAFVGTTAGTLYKTTNGGNTWTSVFAISGSFTNGVYMFNTNYGIYYGDPTGNGVPYQFRITTDGGNTWVISPTAPMATNEFGVINAWDWTDSSHVWVGSANTVASSTTAKVFKTTSGYYTGPWSSATVSGTGGTSGCYYQAVAFINASSGLVGSSGGDIRKTTDGGATYTTVTPPSLPSTFAVISMNSVKTDGTIRMCIQGDTTRVFKTTNLGTTWIRETLPLQATLGQVQHMQFLSANLGFAALGGTGLTGGLIKYTGPSGINNNTGEIPATFSLNQNYPNPFNPSTMISFALPKSGMVTLKIYNSLGKEVETLVNENMAAGNHEITFNASGLTSGIYFYRINANGFTDTKKMMLVK
jgi:photosystem II stability/assembly factor-like uncharacterized protein